MNIKITNNEDAVIFRQDFCQKFRKVTNEVLIVLGWSVDDGTQDDVRATQFKQAQFEA